MSTELPKSTTFETLGYFEDVCDAKTGVCLGTRRVTPRPGRVCGYHGQEEETMTAPFELTRGHKTVTVKASEKKPLRIRTTLQILCGKMLRSIHE